MTAAVSKLGPSPSLSTHAALVTTSKLNAYPVEAATSSRLPDYSGAQSELRTSSVLNPIASTVLG